MFQIRKHRTPARSWTSLLVGACLLLVSALTSCSADSLVEPTPQKPEEAEGANLTLLLNVAGDPSAGTRADSDNPMGGEDGNGLRKGEHHENDIDNLCLFAFADAEQKGVAGLAGETPVKYSRYVDDVNYHPTYAQSYYGEVFTTEVKMKFDNDLVEKTDAYLVVANVGDVTNGLTTLQQVRDYLITKTVTRPTSLAAPLADCTRFAMANAHNSRFKGGYGTKYYPYQVAIDVERITARVDFMFAPTLAADNKPANVPAQPLLGYKVVDKYDNSIQTGWLYISHIKLMNVAQYAPYALKRLALQESDAPAYLLDEEHIDDEAAKYVIEPNTWKKGRGEVTPTALYGNTRIQYASANYQTHGFFTTREAVRNYATPQTAPNTSDGFNFGWSKDNISGEAYYVLDYVNENTVEAAHTTGLNTTSLLLKTKFVPKAMYYMDGTALAMDDAVPATKAASYGTTFWAMEVMTDDRREKLYFDSPEAAEAYKALYPEATYAAPVEFPGGDNYYTIWIRHDNNSNDALIGRMEYGIVRNNIYRIGVGLVLGPGSPFPVDTENPEDVNLHIYVRKWNFMEVPPINI